MKRLRKKAHYLFAMMIAVGLVACAGPEPMLRSNAKFQLQGTGGGEAWSVAACQQKAEAAGLEAWHRQSKW